MGVFFWRHVDVVLPAASFKVLLDELLPCQRADDGVLGEMGRRLEASTACLVAKPAVPSGVSGGMGVPSSPMSPAVRKRFSNACKVDRLQAYGNLRHAWV